jgi:hypothetical protein
MRQFYRYILLTAAVTAPFSGFALPSNCTVGKNVYYISQAGSDSNTQAQAMSNATPWKHAPFMHSFTGKYSHTAGDCFIFRGGDTWASSDYFVITSAGTSAGNTDYYGIDQTWYVGSAWARPIFDIQGTLPNVDSYGNSNIVKLNASWVTFDNWEFVHGTCANGTSQNYFALSSQQGIYVTNSYFHAFEAPTGGCGSGKTGDGNNFGVWVYESVSSSAGCAGSFDHNIVDGTDGSGAKGYDTVVYDPSPCSDISYNVVHDICSAFGGGFTLAHDNEIYNFGGSVKGAFDCTSQGIHNHAIRSNNDADVYNNMIYSVESEVIMVNPNAMAGHSVSHIYNNVLWHNGAYGGAVPVTAIQTGDFPPNTAGSVQIYNNTIDCDSGGGWGSCIRFESNIGTVAIHNEHHIMVPGAPLGGIALGNPPFNSGGAGTASTLSYNAADNLYQTQAQATATGYTNTEAYVFSPTSSSSPTVGIGANATNLCSSGMTQLCLDTTYGSSQSGDTLITPADTPIARPGSNPWDAGAYLYSSSAPPPPPNGLQAQVQ